MRTVRIAGLGFTYYFFETDLLYFHYSASFSALLFNDDLNLPTGNEIHRSILSLISIC